MTVIRLPDDQAAALAGIAAAQGLSLEEWLKKLADEASLPQQLNRARSAAERIRKIRERSKPDPEGWTA